MNKIILKGIIKDIQYSHTVQNIEYYKANLLVKREGNGNKEDLICLKFKRFSCPYKDGDEITLIGNIRTYSQRLGDRNKVEIYVFTYFDVPEEITSCNACELSGRICKKNPIRKTSEGKDVLDFIIANNLRTENQSLNCYIPCVAWGKCAKAIDKLEVGDSINISSSLHSREYKKKISDEDFELHLAHELSINNFNTDKEEVANEISI